MSIAPIKANILTFNRIDDRSVTHYIVDIHRMVDGKVVSEELATIPNPRSINPIKTKERFQLSADQKYKLSRENILYDGTYPIIARINGKRLNGVLVNYNTIEHEVSITYTDIKPWDNIEIEYYFDGVEFKHQTTEECTYKIRLKIDYSLNTVGNHNLLV